MSDESLANLNNSEEQFLMEPHTGSFSHGRQRLKERVKMYVKNNWKLTVIVSVLVATVSSLVTYYSQSRPTPVLTSSHLPSFAKNVLQEEDPSDYEFGIRMDPQIRDCTNERHWKLTFPDLDYSLLGYDILSGYPLADGRDPGFKHPIFRADFSKPKQSSDCRYVFPEGFMVVPSESCVVSFESKLIRNKQQMSEHLSVQASVEGGGWGFEFSASAGYRKDTAEMSSGEFLFVLSHAECQNYYSMIDLTNPPPFDPGFISWAKTLAETQTKEEAVMDFVKYYGTHFFTDVTYGAKFVQHHKVKQKTYESLKKSGITVEAQASYSGLFSIGGGFSLDKEQSDAASKFSKSVETTTYTVGSTPPSNGDALTWAASVSQNPVPVLYSLSPIDVLFTEPFTKRLPPDVNHTAIREKLRNVSHAYCHALRTAGMVPSCEPRFHLQSVGVDINEQGYSSLKNVDNSTCLSFCRQDEHCSSVLYSELLPSLKNSNCRFFNSSVNLTLIDPEIYTPSRLSNLIILVGRQQAFYLNAALEGKPFLVKDTHTLNECDSFCFHEEASSLFCDAYTYNYTASIGSCSLYTTKDIAKIVYKVKSVVRL